MPRYTAFVSYRHADNREEGRRWAEWLHQALETYEVPRDLVGRSNLYGQPTLRSLYPVFRDEVELAAAPELAASIRSALEQSDSLIVLCSPRARASVYIESEIRFFKELGKSDRILALIIDGEPNATDEVKHAAGFQIAQECFLEALRFGVFRDGTVDLRTEPIAADVRPGGRPEQGYTAANYYRAALEKAGTHSSSELRQLEKAYATRLDVARLKILAGVLGVRLGELKNRDAEYRARKFRRLASVFGLLFLFAATGGSVAVWQKKIADTQRNLAEEALRDVRRTLSRSDFLQAGQLLDRGQNAEALAYLSRALRTDAANAAAADLTLSVLARYNWPLPVGPAFRLGETRGAVFDYQAESVVCGAYDTWTVWMTLDGRQVTASLENAGPISSLDFSPNGRAVATASFVFETNEAFGQVWDARSGAPITGRFQLRSGPNSVTFSPDGKTILSTASTAMDTWDSRTGAKLPLTIERADLVSGGIWDPAGKRIATADLFEVLLWDVRTTELAAHPIKQDALATILAFSPDGEKLGIACNDYTARLWEPYTGQPITPPMRHDGSINAFCFSQDGKFLLTGSDDSTAQIWDAQSGLAAMEPLRHKNAVRAAAFVPKLEQVITVSGSVDRSLQRWDIRPGLLRPRSLIHSDRIITATFGAGGRVIATACADGAVRVWDPETKALLIKPLANEGEVSGCAFNRNGETFLTTVRNVARLRETASGKLRGSLPHAGTISHAIFSPDGRQILTTSLDGTAQLWKAADTQPVGPPLQHGAEVTFGSFSPDGGRVVTVAADGKARIWDPAKGCELTKPIQHEQNVVIASFSPDGRRILTASKDKTARLWNADTAAPIGGPMFHDHEVTSAIFSADGCSIVTTSGELGTPGAARVWDAQTGELQLNLSHKDGISAVTIDPQHGRIITGSYDGIVQAWDIHTGKSVWLPLRFEELIKALELSDRRLLIESGNSVFLLDLVDTRNEAPPWLATLADNVAGLRLNETGIVEALAERPLDALRQELGRTQAEDGYLRFGRWFLQDRATRAASPLDAASK